MPEDAGTGGEIVYFSSKKAEEVGFEKFAKRQKQLQGIHIIVLDHMRIRLDGLEDESDEIAKACGHITDLDLGSNLFEAWDEILQLIGLLPKLRNLVLDGNRFNNLSSSSIRELPGIKSVGLSNTLLQWPDIALLTQSTPHLLSLSVANNELKSIGSEALPENIQTLDLAGNNFTAFSDLTNLNAYPKLKSLLLKHNQIDTAFQNCSDDPPSTLSTSIDSIDLAHNTITSWHFFNALPVAYPNLAHLIVANNPLYANLTSAEGKPLTTEDGYMLTIARLPNLQTLNFSRITDKERLNAEVYYLGQIAAELSRAPVEQAEEILVGHPRWKELCEEYGEPAVQRELKPQETDPNSLGAKLVLLNFTLPCDVLPEVSTRTWREEVPKTFNIYAILGIVGKKLGIMPLKLRLIWETGEQDPVGRDGGYTGPEEWDSSDEEDEATSKEGCELIAREVELVAGTRAVGTYVETSGVEARIRVELKN